MPIPLEVLQSLASTFSAVREGPQQVLPGQPVNIRLVPSTAADLHATDLLDAALQLTWITKNVQFKSFGIEPALTADPFNPSSIDSLLEGRTPARLPHLGSLAGFEDLSGTPGQIAQLAGSFPVAVEVPVGLSVTWEVLDADASTVLLEGSSTFTSPTGTTSPAVTFVFAHQIVELTSTMPISTVHRFIRARVTLTAGSTMHTFPLPNIPIDIPAIAIPTAIVFFRHTHFAPSDDRADYTPMGAAFIVVPNNSPLSNVRQLQDVLNALQSALSALTSVAELAAFLLGLSELTGALAAQPRAQLRVANSANHFNDFNEVTLIHRGFFENNIEAEDELSSLIFIAPASDRKVRCFVDENRKGHNFTLTTGAALHVIIRSLHGAPPPAIQPATPPLGGDIDSTGSDSFGDELSSLSFL